MTFVVLGNKVSSVERQSLMVDELLGGSRNHLMKAPAVSNHRRNKRGKTRVEVVLKVGCIGIEIDLTIILGRGELVLSLPWISKAVNYCCRVKSWWYEEGVSSFAL